MGKRGRRPGGPFGEIDRLIAKHKAEVERVTEALVKARAIGFKIVETGIWKCRVRVFSAEREWVRGRSADELLAKVNEALGLYEIAKERARVARAEERRARKEEITNKKAELRALGAIKVRVRRSGLPPPYPAQVWSCAPRRGAEVIEASSAEALGPLVRAAVSAGS